MRFVDVLVKLDKLIYYFFIYCLYKQYFNYGQYLSK